MPQPCKNLPFKAKPEEARNFSWPDKNSIFRQTFAIFSSQAMRSSRNWVIDYSKLLQRGCKGIREEAQARLAALTNPTERVQPEFCAALLKAARGRGINTAIETAGSVPWRALAEVLPHVDTVLHDYKLTDGAAHKRWTGADNTRILDNFRKAYAAFPGVRFVARIPLIPGVNDDEAHIDAVLDAIAPYPNVVELELLPYHRFGDSKYGFLGREYGLEDFSPPPAARRAPGAAAPPDCAAVRTANDNSASGRTRSVRRRLTGSSAVAQVAQRML